MIKFEANPNPDIYDLMTKEVELDFSDVGGEKTSVTIHSLASHKVSDARSKYAMRLEYIKSQPNKGKDLMFEQGKLDAGMGVEIDAMVPTKWNKEHEALLACACVSGYPEDRNLKDDLIANIELCQFIIGVAVDLQSEFLAKKKS